MSMLKRIRSWGAKRRADQAALSPSAREYNALVSRFENRGVLTMTLTGLGPGTFGLATASLWSDPMTAIMVAAAGFVVGAMGLVVAADIYSSKTPRAVREAQEAFYQSAGIEENHGFWGKLKPNEIVATFPRTLADGRSGMVEVVCDSAGNPQLLFKENPAATFIGAPSLGATSRGELKEVAA